MTDEMDAETRAFVDALKGPGPDPYAALARVLAMPERVQRKLLRLVVWCENNKCSPLRVFALREGLLVQCRSDANVRDLRDTYPRLREWSRRRAFFMDEWLSQPADVLPQSRLQVVCDCAQTTPRLVDVQRLLDAVPADGMQTRRLRLPEVAAD